MEEISQYTVVEYTGRAGEGGPWELALHNTPYAEDETYIETFYSYVVLLVRVPKV